MAEEPEQKITPQAGQPPADGYYGDDDIEDNDDIDLSFLDEDKK